MKLSGVVKAGYAKTDKLGKYRTLRIVIPKDICLKLNIKNNDHLAVYSNYDSIIFKKIKALQKFTDVGVNQ